MSDAKTLAELLEEADVTVCQDGHGNALVFARSLTDEEMRTVEAYMRRNFDAFVGAERAW